MSPIFTPDFSSVDANIPIFDKCRAQLKITKVTPNIRESRDRDTGDVVINPNVRYGLEMVGIYEEGKKGKPSLNTEAAGKTVSPLTVWLRTEGGWKFAKPFLMAAAGFNVRNQEAEANATLFNPATPEQWAFIGDPGMPSENIELGAAWNNLVGRHVDVNLIKKIENRDGEDYESQEFSGWTPVES